MIKAQSNFTIIIREHRHISCFMLAGVEKELSMYHVMAWLGGIVVGSVVHLRRKTNYTF